MALIDVAAQPAADPAVAAGLARLMRLPEWLAAVADAEQVSAALRQEVPELASGALTLAELEVDRIRLKRGQDGWNVLYHVTTRSGDGAEQRVTIAGRLVPPVAGALAPEPATAPFGAPEWRCTLPELRLRLATRADDAALPALPLLSDPELARELLERAIRSDSPAYADLRIASCRIKALRYKPGSRATVVYALGYAPTDADRGWPAIVVAKTYHGDKGENAYAGMRALWDAPLRTSGIVGLAEPLAYDPELRVLIQGPLREDQTLEELLKATLRTGDPAARDALRAAMGKTAAGLAALHRSGVGYGAAWTLADEIADVRALIGRLAQALPEVGAALDPLLDRIEAAAAATPADPLGPVHHAFRPAQVMLAGDDINFIDFDGFCQGEPGLDVALFVRKTRAVGLGVLGKTSGGAILPEHLSEVDAICAEFVRDYMAHAPLTPRRAALWEALDLATLVLFCWTKVEPQRLAANMLLLERHLQANDLA